VQKYVAVTRQSGIFAARRAEQERQWVRSLVQEGLDELFRNHPAIRDTLPALEEQVARGELPATAAAARLLAAFREGLKD